MRRQNLLNIFSMTKTIKLQPKLRQLADCTKIVPELKISGVWLEEIGFKAGQKVSITTGKKELIIRPSKEWKSGR
jgi:hypothetical protein